MRNFLTISQKLLSTTWLALVILTAIPLSAVNAQDKPSSTEPRDIFPLKRGLKWEYECSDFTAEGKEEKFKKTVETGDTIRFDGKPCREMIAKYKSNGINHTYTKYIYVHEGSMFDAGEKNKWLPSDDDGHINEYKNKPSLRQLNYSDTKASSWTTTYKLMIRSDDGRADAGFEHRVEIAQMADKVKLVGREYAAIRTDQAFFDNGKPQPNYARRDWYVVGKGLVRTEMTAAGRLFKVEQLVAFNGVSNLSIGAVVVGPNEFEKEASVESLESLPGVITEFKRSRTITREVSYSISTGLSTEIGSAITGDMVFVKGELNSKVKASVEATMGQRLNDSETREQTVRIDGNVLPKAKMVWIDIYRTGTVELISEGRSYKIPFEFPAGTKLVIRKP